jgi:hypothetical protein
MHCLSDQAVPGEVADRADRNGVGQFRLDREPTELPRLFKINPAVLMDDVAGVRSHSGPAREAAAEIGSSAPWIGFPVGYAVSGILLTVFGNFAMLLAQ